MSILRVQVPVFNPEQGDPVPGQKRMLGLESERSGLRVILDESGTGREHDLLIERHADGKWAIMLHANGGDPLFYISVHDDKVLVEYEGEHKKLGRHAERPGVEFPVEPPGEGDPEWYCQSCEFEGLESDFIPDVQTRGGGEPNVHVCPECGSTDTFFKD